jgi:hypothetical protein
MNGLSGGVNLTWVSRPVHGQSGGILVGIRSDTMDVWAISGGDFHIKLHIRKKSDNFLWSLVAVYGAAQNYFHIKHLEERLQKHLSSWKGK